MSAKLDEKLKYVMPSTKRDRQRPSEARSCHVAVTYLWQYSGIHLTGLPQTTKIESWYYDTDSSSLSLA
jgi:hypothetical protein